MDNLWTIRIFFDGDAADPAVYPLKSCSIPRCVGAAGTHAQQKATVSISGPTVSLSLKLVGRKEQTKAEIYEGTAIRFTGLIDTDWDFDAKGRLIESVSLTVMDYSGKLKIGVFGKDVAPENARLVRGPQRWQNYAVCDPASQDTSIVHQILKLAAGFLGITIPVKCDATCTTRLDYFQLEQDPDLKTQLEQLLKEFRLDYIFDADNSIRIISTDSTGEPVATVTDFRNSLRGSGSVYKPKSIKATWRKYERRVGEKIGEGYHKSDSVNSRSVEYGQDVTWSLPDGANLDDLEIVSIENLNPGSTWTETGVTHPRIDGASAKITSYDLEGCHIVMERHGACAKGYIRARITADIVIRYNKTQELYSNPGTTQESLTLLHHHQLSSSDGIEGATEYAMYYEAMKRKASTTYTFSSLSEYAPGAIVTLSESSVTGISAKVRILEQTLDPLTGIYKYKAEGAGDLDLKEAITKAETSEDHPIYGGDFLELSADLDESTGVVTVVAEGDAIDYYGLTPAWNLNGTSVTSTGLSVTFPVRDLALSGNVVTCTATLNGETVTATYDIDQLLSAPTLAIFTGDGSLFPAGLVNATLSAVLMRSGVDVALANESVFRWARTSSDTVADATWNASAKATGKRSIIITDSDLVNGKAVFTVSCTIGTITYTSAGFSVVTVSDGQNGWSNATCQLFKRSASAPSAYDGKQLTYTFATATLTGNTGTWSRTIPSGDDPLYVIYASAFAAADTDIVETTDWTAPAILSENGTVGQSGMSVKTILLYQRSETAPALPTGQVTYNFDSGKISGQGAWSLDVPTTNGSPLWVISATAASRSASDIIEPSEWSTQSIMAKDGEQGPQGEQGAKGDTGEAGPKGETGATGTSIIGIVEEYALSSSSSSVTGSWGTAVPTLSPTDKYLWNRSKTMYSDGTSSAYTTAVVIGVYGDTGKTGATGAQGPSPALLSIDTDTVYVNAYSDGPAKGFEGAEVNASVTVGGVKQEGWAFSVSGATKVTVSVDAMLGKYTITAIDDNARSGSFVVVASKDGKTLYAQAYVQKMYEIGTVLAEASGSVFGYYADNVPHNATESIEVTVTLAGYSPSYAPRCTLGAEDVTLANGKYVITADDVKSRDYVTFSAIGIHNTSSITVRKVLDVASLSLSVDKTSFGYYADGTAHSGEGACTVTIVASGMSHPPTLKVAGKAKALTASAPKYTASVTNADLEASNAPTKVEATYGSLSRTETLVKVFDQPTITLVLSKDTFGYYADNVAHEEETGITASVSYRGLYEKPLLSVGGVQTALGKDNTCVIPPSAVADKDSVAVEAYSAHIDTNTLLASRFIFKVKDQPSISLVASATQFHQAGDGTVAPDEIVVTPKVSGLSPSAGITYEFGGSAVSLTDGAYVVGKDAVETYKTMTATWNGKLYDSLTILKTIDGKAMTYMYASAPEGLYPCEYPFGIDQNAIGMADTAIGINFAWVDTVPDIAEGYVLWTKTAAPDGTVSIYRVQGPKGEPGETGPRGPQGPKGESEGTYLGTGTSTTIPTKRPDGSDITEGDFYLDITNTETPIPYEMKNGKWTAVDGSSAKWSVVASAVQGDVAKYCPNISNSNGLYGFFKNLSAVNGFVDGLGTRQLTISNGGYIQSQSYADSNGLEGFYLPDDGNAIFETGLFRGGISNGWTIFGGLDIDVAETMTQKELYSAFRMAGIGNGLYFSLGLYGNYGWKNQHTAAGNPYAAMLEYGFTKFESPVMWQDFSANDFSSPAYLDIYALGETTFLLIAYANSAYHAYKVDTSFLHDPDTTQTWTALGQLRDALETASTIGTSPYSTDVSGTISGNEHSYDLYLVANGKLYIGTTTCTVLDLNLNTLGTLRSSDGNEASLPLLWSKPSMVTYDGTSYMYMVINDSLCFASSTDGIVWTKGFDIPRGEDYTQNYYYYSPVLVDGTWYCLRAIYSSSAKSVTMQFCKTSGTAFVVVKEFSAITYDDYNDSEMNFLAYGEGKLLFSCPSDKVLYIYDIATQKLESDYSLANVPVYREYIGNEANVSAHGASLLGNEYIEIQNLTAVHGIWFDNAKKRFIILLVTTDDIPVLRFFYPDTMKSEYISTLAKAQGSTMNFRAYGNTLWFDGNKIAFGYKGSFYTLEPMIKVAFGENMFGFPTTTKMLAPYSYSPDAMSAELDLNRKHYKLHFYFNGTWVREGNDDLKDVTIDGTSNALVPFAGKFCLRPSITAPRGAIISGAKFLMTGASTS